MRMLKSWTITCSASLLLAWLGSCGPSDQGATDDGDGKGDTSAVAVFLDFAFDGELLASSSSFNRESVIESQLLYTVGQLNGDNSVSRIDRLELSNVQSAPDPSGKNRITYHARMVVAWGKRQDVPSSYRLIVPRDLSYEGQQAFVKKYKERCVDWGAHEVDQGTLWYYWRPTTSGCELAPTDVVPVEATASPSAIATSGKYPEYNKVWEDAVFKVVAIFGKYEDGATGHDAGISAYNEFVASARKLLAPHNPTTLPAVLPTNPGIETPEVSLAATLRGGRRVEIVALLVDNVRQAGPTFDKRYLELSSQADLIVYNGHSGLGANIRALAMKGNWVAEQYVIVFMNGCDTYAYVDSALAEAHAIINPEDPVGTRYVDVVTNAMPSFFSNMADSTLVLVRALLAYDVPKTYEKIFEEISSTQVVLVSGEQDNEFVP